MAETLKDKAIGLLSRRRTSSASTEDKHSATSGRAHSRGRGGYQKNYNRSDNFRTEFNREEEGSDATEIRRQVEFYFSDSNLPIGEGGILLTLTLTLKSKKDYVDQKSMDILDGKVKPKSPTRYGCRLRRAQVKASDAFSFSRPLQNLGV